MRPSDLRRLDLNLLTALFALLTERSVTRAARAIGLSQPAVSRALNRLRQLFDDPLLIRAGREMSLTSRAEQLLIPMSEVVRALEQLLQAPAFDPKIATRHVRVCATDAVTESTLAKALSAIACDAPNLTFEIIQMTSSALAMVAEETVDFAIDVFPAVPRGFRKRDLFFDQFVCLLRSGHPLLRGPLTRSAYARALHIRISGTGGTSVELDDALRRCRIERRIAIELPSFMAAPLFLLETDWLLTLPSGPAGRARRNLPLEIAPVPFSVPPIPLTLVWHERSDRDQSHLWLREKIASFFTGQMNILPRRTNATDAERHAPLAQVRFRPRARRQ